jgi:ABC-type multidrug transport system ATPase subunit
MSTQDQENYRNTLVGFVFQDFHLIDDLTVYDNIKLALELQNITDDNIICQALEQVGLKGYENRYPTEISGGEKQRVAIARALVKDPKVILADEPTGNLDSKTTTQIMQMLKDISREKLVIVVSHNLLDAYEYADRILELSEGRILNDLDRDAAYREDVVIDNGVLTIPLLKKLDEAQLGQIETAFSTGQVKSLKQNDSKFKQAKEPEYQKNPIQLWKRSLSMKSQLKLCWKFAKRQSLQSALSAVIAACLVIILIFCQTMIYFDQGKVLANELSKDNAETVVLKKTAMDGYVNLDKSVTYLTDEEYNEILQKMDTGKVYRMTNYGIGIHGMGNLMWEKGIGYVPFEGEYIAYTLGNLECDEAFLAKKYGVDGKLDIYTGDVEYKKSGIYITDYVADSILLRGSLGATDYDDLLGNYSIYKPNDEGETHYQQAYINGINTTGYEERYEEVLTFMRNKQLTVENLPKDNPLFIAFYDEVAQYLGVTYSFEENFIEEVANDLTWNFLFFNNLKLDDVPVTDKVAYFYGKVDYMLDMDLEYDEIVIDYRLCNELLETNYTKEQWEAEEPRTVRVTRSHLIDIEDKDPIVDMDMTLRAESFGDGKIIIVSKELMQDVLRKQFVCTDLYFDEVEDLNTITQIGDEYDMSPNSVELGAMLSMSYTVRVFENLFVLIFAVLCLATVLILVRFGRKIVKDRIYEIGVIKALGGTNRSFVLIFGLQVVALGVLTCLFTFAGMHIFIDIANSILLASYRSMINSYIITDIQLLLIDTNMVLIDAGAVLLLSLLATVIPLISLNRIKPINIIKAKE